MAAKAVNLYCSIAVAFLAKTLFPENAFCFRTGVAIDAILQTILGGTNALTKGLVALVDDEFHVLFAHDVRFSHTLVAGRRDLGMGFQRAFGMVLTFMRCSGAN